MENWKSASLSQEDILHYASRYIPTENEEFTGPGELFYFLHRKKGPHPKPDSTDNWVFSGYGKISHYMLDDEAVPKGKWIFMFYWDLSRFPLKEQVLKLQPPHVVLGRFFTPDRSAEIRMIKCPLNEKIPQEATKNKDPGKILPFPGQKQASL